MKIFYLTNFNNKTKEMQEKYDFVLDRLLRTDSEIISPEKGEFLGRHNKIRDAKLKIMTEHDNDSLINKLNSSDVLIVENSYDSFLLGHIVTIALQRRNPVLLLFEKPQRYIQLGLKPGTKYLYIGFYEKDSLMKIILDFLEETKRYYQTDHLHIKLSKEHKEFLKVIAKREDNTVSEYIREFIEKKMLKPDLIEQPDNPDVNYI